MKAAAMVCIFLGRITLGFQDCCSVNGLDDDGFQHNLVSVWIVLALRDRTNEEVNDLPAFSHVYHKNISKTVTVNN